jgi:hypothetical protein
MANKRKTILLLSDDLRMHSGIATMSKELVLGTLHKYDWIQLGAAINHPEQGKIVEGRLFIDGTIKDKNYGFVMPDPIVY